MHVLAEGVEQQGTEIEMVSVSNECRTWRILCPSRATRRHATECDIVHAQYGSGCMMLCSRLAGPRVVSLRGSDWYGWDSRSIRGRLHYLLSRKLTRICMQRFDLVIAMSNRMCLSIQEEFPSVRCEVLPDALDLEEFRPMRRADARRLLGVEDDASPWVLFSSVLDCNPLKRRWLAEAAFQELKRRIPAVKLKTLTGLPHHEVPVVINACDALLLTSTHEGWPNIVKEAMACNVPFVSTDVSDLAEIACVEPACHVTDADPKALAECLEDVLTRPRPANLREHIEHMDLPIIARKLIGLYEQVINGRL